MKIKALISASVIASSLMLYQVSFAANKRTCAALPDSNAKVEKNAAKWIGSFVYPLEFQKGTRGDKSIRMLVLRLP